MLILIYRIIKSYRANDEYVEYLNKAVHPEGSLLCLGISKE